MTEQMIRQAIRHALAELIARQPVVEDEEVFAPELLTSGEEMMVQLPDGSLYEISLIQVG